MVTMLITLVIAIVIAGLLMWVVSLLPISAPWNRVVQVLILLITLIVVLETLVPGFHLR